MDVQKSRENSGLAGMDKLVNLSVGANGSYRIAFQSMLTPLTYKVPRSSMICSQSRSGRREGSQRVSACGRHWAPMVTRMGEGPISRNTR